MHAHIDCGGAFFVANWPNLQWTFENAFQTVYTILLYIYFDRAAVYQSLIQDQILRFGNSPDVCKLKGIQLELFLQTNNKDGAKQFVENCITGLHLYFTPYIFCLHLSLNILFFFQDLILVPNGHHG